MGPCDAFIIGYTVIVKLWESVIVQSANPNFPFNNNDDDV